MSTLLRSPLRQGNRLSHLSSKVLNRTSTSGFAAVANDLQWNYSTPAAPPAAPAPYSGGSFTFSDWGTKLITVDRRFQGTGQYGLITNTDGRLGVTLGNEWTVYQGLLVAGQGATQKVELDVTGRQYCWAVLQQTIGNTGTGYTIALTISGNVQLRRNGTFIGQGSTVYTPTTSSPVRLRIEITSGTVNCYANDELQITYNDSSPITGGYPGFNLGGGGPSVTDMFIDNLTDLTISSSTPKYIVLTGTDSVGFTASVQRSRSPIATTSDIVSSTSWLNRSRSAIGATSDLVASTTSASRTRSLSGSTSTVAAGSLGVQRSRSINGSMTDSVISTVTLTVLNAGPTPKYISATAVDSVLTSAALRRTRRLVAAGGDVVASNAFMKRSRSFAASSTDAVIASVDVERLRSVVTAATTGCIADVAVDRIRSIAATLSDTIQAAVTLTVVPQLTAKQLVITASWQELERSGTALQFVTRTADFTIDLVAEATLVIPVEQSVQLVLPAAQVVPLSVQLQQSVSIAVL